MQISASLLLPASSSSTWIPHKFLELSVRKLLLYFYDLPLSAFPLLVPILFTDINSYQKINRNLRVTLDRELNILSPIHLQYGNGRAHVAQMISHKKKDSYWLISWFFKSYQATPMCQVMTWTMRMLNFIKYRVCFHQQMSGR